VAPLPAHPDGDQVAPDPEPPALPEPLGPAVYVHVPFCHVRCPYCDFAVRPYDPAEAPVLVRAVTRELALRAPRANWGSLYFGGGTPSRLSPEDCLASARALSRAPGFAAARRAFGARRLPVGTDPGALGGIPVTIAWGTRDLVLPYRRQAARARDELPAARHVLLPGCGHLPFADDPARCAELLTVRQ